MRYQDKSFSCGPAALGNALRALGGKVAERRLRPLAGCTPQGTEEDGLISAARNLGYTATTHWSDDQNAAWSFVRANVAAGKPVVLCIDNWGHWVTVVGIVGERVLVADPTFAKSNQRENGIHSLGRRDLLKRWRHRRAHEPFYAIAIGK